MKNAVSWMARNSVASNILMLILIMSGIFKAGDIKQEVFPEITLDMIQISVAYPGAGPEEVERGILLQIEDNLTGIDGIKKIDAVASEGLGTVTAEVLAGHDPDKVTQDIKNAVDRIVTFPEDAEKPIISKMLNRMEVIGAVVYGDVSEHTLREYAEIVRDDLLYMPQITNVELTGIRPYEISIEITEETLRRYNLTLEHVAGIIRRASVDLPGGTIRAQDGNILLRTKERRYFGKEYEDITILVTPEGTDIKLSDIATIKDSFVEIDEFARFNGHSAAMIKVFRVGQQKPDEISAIVKKYVKEKSSVLPDSIKIATWNDMTELFQGRKNLLMKNAFIGLTLVICILGLFLEIRLALWVMMGIPISFFGSIFLLYILGLSINMISLFAFILALGIVVDDAIVVGENIYKHRQMGKPYINASVEGVTEVSVPVIFSILTTVVAFFPLVVIPGMMGKFIKVIPLVVISILIMSLVECLFVLPAHLAHGKVNNNKAKGILGLIEKLRNAFSNKMAKFVAGPYKKTLALCIRNRYATLAMGISMLFISVGLVGGGLVKFTFMPNVDSDMIIVSLRMPEGTPIGETEKVQKYILKKAEEVNKLYKKERDGTGIMESIYSVLGLGGLAENKIVKSTNISEIFMFLQKSEERGIAANDIGNRWRDLVGDVPGVDSITFDASLVHMGKDIDIQISHNNFDVLVDVSKSIRNALVKYPGVEDITDNLTKGKKELKLKLKPEARTLNVTEEDLGRQVRGAFYGAEALRLQRGRNEVKVMVRYPYEARQSLKDFESMRIRTPDGSEIPITLAAYIEKDQGVGKIKRKDRKRISNITASVDSNVANAQEILFELKNGLFKELAENHPGLTFDMEGEEKERQESFTSMKSNFLLALFAIFSLLAIPLRSYVQPILIMAAIPFGIVGAVLGHLIMGYDLSMLSLFGIVALAGVVVNDSLLLIHKINRNAREVGMSVTQAVLEGGQSRFRPIILTSLTTFFGLFPMILETSIQAKFLIPMAISLGCGILFATGITLLLIPSLYMILEDFRKEKTNTNTELQLTTLKN